jgi:hypothetical protein
MTTEFPMLDATVALRADFIRLSKCGLHFTAKMLEDHLNDPDGIRTHLKWPVINAIIQSNLLAPQTPTETQWVVTEDSDINDKWGEGLQIQTSPMSWDIQAPIALVQLMEFIRDNGVTDNSCRLSFVIDMPGLQDINPLELLFLIHEEENIKMWSRMARFTVKSHLEHLAAELHTNLYWHRSFDFWVENVSKGMSYDRGFTVNLGTWMGLGSVEFNIVQGPHYEHQVPEIIHTLQDCTRACRDAVMTRTESREAFINTARAFWFLHIGNKDNNARFRDLS